MLWLHSSPQYDLEDFRNGPPKPSNRKARAILMKSCADTCADAQTRASAHFARNPGLCGCTGRCAYAHYAMHGWTRDVLAALHVLCLEGCAYAHVVVRTHTSLSSLL